MNARLRTLVVAPFGVLGGQERWLLQVLDATDRLSVEAVLLADGPLRQELERRGIPTEVLHTSREAAGIAWSGMRLGQRLRRRRPHVVMANGVKAAAVGAVAGRVSGVPVLWFKHDLSFDTWLSAPLSRAVDAVVAVSPGVAAAVGRPVPVVPPPRPSVDFLDRPDARRHWVERFPSLTDARIVGMTTRLVPYKGVDDVIRALAHPAAGGWQLVVAGEDDPSTPGERRRLERLAVGVDVADRVHFAGQVSAAARLIRGFDAVAVTTRREGAFGGEGFPLAALEALAAGVPLIGTEETPALREMAQAAGVAVASRDAEAIAAALAALANPAALARAAHAGAAFLAGHPDARQVADAVVDRLAETCWRPGRGRRRGPATSVLTAVRDEEAVLDDLLAAVTEQLGPDDEYLVVDDGSTDATVDILRAWADRDHRVRWLSRPASGVAAARNAAVSAARHPHVAMVDAGCTPRPGWLDALRRALASTSAPGLVVGVYSVAADDAWQRAMAHSCFPALHEARAPGPLTRLWGRVLGRSFGADRLDTRSCAFRRDAWEAVGGFDETLATAEDAAFGGAVGAAGIHRVLSLDAEVVWAPRPTVAATARMYYRYGHGGARAGRVGLVARDLLRAVAVPTGTWLLAAGGRRRAVAAVAATVYLSVPAVRAARAREGPLTFAAIPAALALKDLAKAAGCVVGLATARSAVAAPGQQRAQENDLLGRADCGQAVPGGEVADAADG